PRRAKYTMICNEDGGVLDDLVVYRLDDDSYFIVANAANVDEVVTALQHRVQGFDASVRDSSPDWALIAVQGPVSAEVLRQLTRGTDIDALRYFAIERAVVAERAAMLART